MKTFLLVIHGLAALALIGLVLVQHGKGADMGAAFGSGASQTLFGSRGSANFLTRTTAVLATIFFLTSLGLGYLETRETHKSGTVTSVTSQPQPAQQAPAVPAPPPVPK